MYGFIASSSCRSLPCGGNANSGTPGGRTYHARINRERRGSDQRGPLGQFEERGRLMRPSRGSENREVGQGERRAAQGKPGYGCMTTRVARVIVNGGIQTRHRGVLVVVRSRGARMVMGLRLRRMISHFRVAKQNRDGLGNSLKGHHRNRQCENDLCHPTGIHVTSSLSKKGNKRQSP